MSDGICNASGGTNSWAGNRGASGSFNTGVLTNTKVYSIICFSGVYASAQGSTTITVATTTAQPTIVISATSASIAYNGSSTINWEYSVSGIPVSGGTCITSNGIDHSLPVSKNSKGSFNTGPLASSTIYTINCSSEIYPSITGGSIMITVAPAPTTTTSSPSTPLPDLSITNTLPAGAEPISNDNTHLLFNANPSFGTTSPFSNITVATDVANEITQNTATLHGVSGINIYPPGCTSLTGYSTTDKNVRCNSRLSTATDSSLPNTAYFRYSTSPISPVFCNDIYGSNMTSTKDIKMGTSYQNLKEGNGNVYNQSSKLNYFYQVITNLAPDTTYYYCAIVSNKKMSYMVDKVSSKVFIRIVTTRLLAQKMQLK